MRLELPKVRVWAVQLRSGPTSLGVKVLREGQGSAEPGVSGRARARVGGVWLGWALKQGRGWEQGGGGAGGQGKAVAKAKHEKSERKGSRAPTPGSFSSRSARRRAVRGDHEHTGSCVNVNTPAELSPHTPRSAHHRPHASGSAPAD